MIDKLYYFFIKTKYTQDYTDKDVEQLDVLFKRISKAGVPITALSTLKRSAIEQGLLKHELSEGHRHVDNFILSTPSIVEAFVESETGYNAKMQRLASKLYKA